ncbi:MULTISPECIES: response regulator transcription factor [Acetobacter]|uniref:Two component response regulator PhoB n=1 Tax=Acetobacter tropicalis NBRC 101654 TaxID=749388 RepID=F7VE45_9PROT|nr:MULTISPECIES: response regulator transcription factor [Acetobacter]MCG4258406.1 response regulator transcription factor [Acetobacter senegalensis]MCG4261538.1 response regulator transcription factor [Acetobacter senegalensis]MCG4268332.1 response regulator transcription factor [Acetobacter senegalensis]MCP1194822.1 response regulator transcription factor [Acetobacter senegalensis]MPQ74007.1 response regulator [Acetobacter senegalensis]
MSAHNPPSSSSCESEKQTPSLEAEIPHILVVEDDPEICGLLQRYLKRLGYQVSTAVTLAEVMAVQQNAPVDLTLLDLMLPQEDGQTICRHLRQFSDTRIVMLSALNDLRDRISGLDLGADDYISKPFDLEELGARIRAVLRRTTSPVTLPAADQTLQYRFDNWLFEPAKRALYAQTGIRIALTGSETDLLLIFCQNVQRVFPREELLARMHGEEKNVDSRAIDLLISRLRRKLSHQGRQLELIRTIRGDGYIFDPDTIRS